MYTPVRPLSYLGFLFMLCTVVSVQAQEMPSVQANDRPTGPVAVMEFKETTYDFGSVKEGTIVTQVFTFTNTSDKPLILIDAKGSCGCTVPEWPRTPIAPGETASLTVEFNSKNKRGKRSQKVTLTANTNPPQTFLYLQGEVISDDDASKVTIDKVGTKVDPDCFAIYPNPTADILKLEMQENNLGKRATISIFSKNGQLMAKRNIDMISGAIEFDVSHYPAGTYMANVQVGNSKPETRCFVVVE